jgi:large subunit ribosomal protein L24
MPNTQRKPEKRKPLHVRKGDTVLVLAGRDKGKRGSILQAFPEKERVVVEGVNMVTRHRKPRPGGPRGQQLQTGTIEKPAPIHVSNVMLVCPRCEQPTRARRVISEGGRKVRACRSCGELIDAI